MANLLDLIEGNTEDKEPVSDALAEEIRVLEGDMVKLISRRRLQILIHSCMYYKLGETIVTDEVWDQWAKNLVELQKMYPELAAKAPLHDIFDGWEGESGFDLPIDEEWLIVAAQGLIAKHHAMHGKMHPLEMDLEMYKQSFKARGVEV